MLSSFRGKSCSSCGCFVSPPENYKARADVGYCPDLGMVNERALCNFWQAHEED
jgi:hypothetical protein